MKSGFTLFLVVTCFVSVTFAQEVKKFKGETCKENSECLQPANAQNIEVFCVDNYCGCKFGEKQHVESHPGNQNGIPVCQKVVGLGCNRHEDCSEDLKNAKCNLTDNANRCICLKEDDCNGASFLTIFSSISMIFIAMIILKF